MNDKDYVFSLLCLSFIFFTWMWCAFPLPLTIYDTKNIKTEVYHNITDLRNVKLIVETKKKKIIFQPTINNVSKNKAHFTIDWLDLINCQGDLILKNYHSLDVNIIIFGISDIDRIFLNIQNQVILLYS